MIAIGIIMIWQNLCPISCNIWIGTTHGLLLIIAFLSVSSDTNRPWRTCSCILNCRRGCVVCSTCVNLAVANNCFVGSSLNTWHWKRTNGSKRCGNDVNKRLIGSSKNGFCREAFNEENDCIWICIQNCPRNSSPVPI